MILLEINTLEYVVEYNYVCILSLYYDIIKISFILLRYIEYHTVFNRIDLDDQIVMLYIFIALFPNVSQTS